MRITTNAFYNNFITNQQTIKQHLNKVYEQVSSGVKIRYGYEDPQIFNSTLRLDYEEATLEQVIDVSTDARNFANNTDSVMSQFIDALTRFKQLMVQAANGTNDDSNYYAISNELKALKEHMINLSNTSINGRYLFSGTALDVEPIDETGAYNGNGNELSAVVGSGIEIPYNISGEELFLGTDENIHKKITTNHILYDNEKYYPQIVQEDGEVLDEDAMEYITGSNTIRQLVGDNDNLTENNSATYFYLQGTTHEGEAFKSKISFDGTQTVGEVLDWIGMQYGNTSTKELVSVTLNEGRIEVRDNRNGSSLLDFNLVAATDIDYDPANGNRADIDDTTAYPATAGVIDNLNGGDTLDSIMENSGNTLLLTAFQTTGTTTTGNQELLTMDRVYLEQDGNLLLGNASQIVKSDNSYADETTLLSEVAGSDLQTKSFTLEYTGLGGSLATATITMDDGTGVLIDPDTSVSGDEFHLYNADGSGVTTYDQMTYRQLTNAISVVMSGNLPASDSAADVETAVSAARDQVDVMLDSKGRLRVEDKTATSTSMQLALYDSNAGDFTATEGSTLKFSANRALTIDEPQHDLFEALDMAVEAVEEGLTRPDASNNFNVANIGIQNAMERLDHVFEHVDKAHTKIGSVSNSLTYSLERSESLKLNVQTLRSEVIDTDLAEAAIRLEQLTINYQAMMATIAKVQGLSLVNYL